MVVAQEPKAYPKASFKEDTKVFYTMLAGLDLRQFPQAPKQDFTMHRGCVVSVLKVGSPTNPHDVCVEFGGFGMFAGWVNDSRLEPAAPSAELTQISGPDTFRFQALLDWFNAETAKINRHIAQQAAAEQRKASTPIPVIILNR